MTFLEKLQSHKGGLIKLKTELYWYGGRGWDENPGRVCLLLDSHSLGSVPEASASSAPFSRREAWDVHLLIDGSPQWVWMEEKDVELL